MNKNKTTPDLGIVERLGAGVAKVWHLVGLCMCFEEKCVCFREYVNPISYSLSIRCLLLFRCPYSIECFPCHYKLATRAYIRNLFPKKSLHPFT